MDNPLNLQDFLKIKSAWDSIHTVNPAGEGYKTLCEYLDTLDTGTLSALAGAQIKFVSNLAANRIAVPEVKNAKLP